MPEWLKGQPGICFSARKLGIKRIAESWWSQGLLGSFGFSEEKPLPKKLFLSSKKRI